MHAKHADATSTLTGLWARGELGRTYGVSRGRLATQRQPHQPGLFAVQSVMFLNAVHCRTSTSPPVGSRIFAGAKTNARSAIAVLLPPTHQVGQRTQFICVFCVHRLPLFAVKFFLPGLPEVRADPNIVTEPGHGGFGGLVPYVNLSADWYKCTDYTEWKNSASREAHSILPFRVIRALTPCNPCQK